MRKYDFHLNHHSLVEHKLALKSLNIFLPKRVIRILICLFITNTSITNEIRAECTPTPDCAEIGYSDTYCESKFTRCPFDTSKLFCIPCDSSYKYTCDGNYSINASGNSCGGKYASCECVFGATLGQQTCECDNTCSIGNIYYSDGTCSSCIEDSKLAVGIVVKNNQLIMSPAVIMPFSPNYINIPELPDITNIEKAKLDYSGFYNTAAIVNYYGENAANTGAVYCYNYAPNGLEDTKNQWYLPAAGELKDYLANNFSKINPTINKLGWSYMSTYAQWSSTEYNAEIVWYVVGYTGHIKGLEIDYSGYKISPNTTIVCFLNIS